MFRRLLFLVPVALTVAACEVRTPSSPSGSGRFGGAEPCASDAPWLGQIMGEQPSGAVLVGLDAMRHQGAWASDLQKSEAAGQFVSAEFADVFPSLEEIYGWQGPPPGSPGEVVIIRKNSSRDPCSLRWSFSGSPPRCRYGTPSRLPSGVLEYPANPGALYAFPDGTWVRVADWMVPRFRAAFSGSSASPPRPMLAPNVALEMCGLPTAETTGKGGLDRLVGGSVRPDRATLRYFADRDPSDTEVVFSYSSPGLAARAETETRGRCARHACPDVLGGNVEGSRVRYHVRTSSPLR